MITPEPRGTAASKSRSGGGAKPKNAVTIYDVAEEAGVAASTVSRAFTRPDRVSFKTAEKVRAAADRLGYRSELATRGSRGVGTPQKTNNIGLVVADLSNPFFLELMRGAEHAAKLQGMMVAVVNAKESVPRALTGIKQLLPHVDGLLLASTRLTSGEIQKVARMTPTVVVNRPVKGVPSVLVDNYEGAMKAASHLGKQGVRSITYLAGPHDSWADGMRLRGLIDAVGSTRVEHATVPQLDYTRSSPLTDRVRKQLSHITVRQLHIDEPTMRGGRRAFQAWSDHPTDAVIGYNDLAAIGFIQEAKANGVEVPRDVAVLGFDNTEITTLTSPTLTTVAGPLRSIGRVGAANLIALIKGLKGPMAKPRILPTRLITRESSAWEQFH